MTECKNCIKQDVCDRDVGHGYSVCPHYLSAGVVEVVRCKDCVVPHNQWTGCPKLNGLVTSHDFYCSYGERRKEDEEK